MVFDFFHERHCRASRINIACRFQPHFNTIRQVYCKNHFVFKNFKLLPVMKFCQARA